MLVKKKMLSGYYKIWADAIALEKANKERRDSWKLFTIIPMSVLQGINLFTLLVLIRALSQKRYPIVFPMDVFKGRGYNSVLSIILTYFLPFVIINYLLIFYNNRYEKLINKFGDRKGKLYKTYALVSIAIIGIPYVLISIF